MVVSRRYTGVCASSEMCPSIIWHSSSTTDRKRWMSASVQSRGCNIDYQWCVAGLWSRSRRLGLETISRRTNVSSRSRLEKNCQRLGLVSVSRCRRLDLVSVSSRSRPFTCRVQHQFSAKMCRPH